MEFSFGRTQRLLGGASRAHASEAKFGDAIYEDERLAFHSIK